MKTLTLETSSPSPRSSRTCRRPGRAIPEKEGIRNQLGRCDDGGIKTSDISVASRSRRTNMSVMATCWRAARPTCTMLANGATPLPGRLDAGEQPPTRPPRNHHITLRSWYGPNSPVYTAQQLRQPHGRRAVLLLGTHYLALHLLEGFLSRDEINLRSAPQAARAIATI